MQRESLTARGRSALALRADLHLLFLPAVIMLALLAGIYPIARGLGQDELFTAVNFVEADSVLRTVFYNDAFNNHPAYSLLARLSEVLFGRAEWSLRLPALLFGLVSIYVFFLLSQALLGRRTARIATFLLAISPPHVLWSTQARGYSGVLCCTLVSSYLYLKLLRAPRRRYAVLFVVVSVYAIWIHLYAGFVTLVQVALLLWNAQRSTAGSAARVRPAPESARLWRTVFLAIGALALLCYLPMAPIMYKDLAGQSSGAFNPTFPWTLAQQLTGSEWAPTESWPIVLLVLLLASAGGFALRRTHPVETRYFTCLLLGPLLVVWLAHPLYLYPRFFAYYLPYYMLFFAAGLRLLWFAGARAARRSRYLVHGAAVVVASIIVFNWTANWPAYIPDEGYRAVSHAALQDASTSTGYCAIGGARTVWQYYINQPIMHPESLEDLQALGSKYTEIRCVYYAASWQNGAQTALADYLFAHAAWLRTGDLAWFAYRPQSRGPGSGVDTAKEGRPEGQ